MAKKTRRKKRPDPEKLTIWQMRAFVAIYERVCATEQSLRRICKDLGFGEKFITNVIEPLFIPEDKTWKLIDRDTGGYSKPTDYGNELYEYFKEIISRFDLIATSPKLGNRNVRIKTFRAAINMLLAEAYSEFVQRTSIEPYISYQNANVTVHTAFGDNIQTAVESGRYHIGIGYQGEQSKGIETIPLFQTEMVLIHHVNHLFKSHSPGTPLNLESLRSEKLLILPEDSLINRFVSHHMFPPIRSGARVVLPSVVYLYEWVKRDFGVGFCFRDLIPPQDQPVLKAISLNHLELPETRKTVWLYLRPNWENTYPLPARLFVDCIQASAAAIATRQQAGSSS